MRSSGFTPGARPNFAVNGFWLYASEGKPILHVIEVKTMPTPRRGALDHMAFRGENMASTLDWLKGRNIQYRLTRAPDPFRTWQLFFPDPNGVEVEIDFDPTRAAAGRLEGQRAHDAAELNSAQMADLARRTARASRSPWSIGATSKWQSDGRNTRLVHGKAVDDSDLPVGVRWGIGGAIAQKFARRRLLRRADDPQRGQCGGPGGGDPGAGRRLHDRRARSRRGRTRSPRPSPRSAARPAIREVLVYNAGYLEGRDLPPEKELLEHIPVEMFDTAQHIASRGPFLVAKEVLPAMRKRGEGSFFFSNNSSSLRGRKRMTGQSLYYPRVMMRTLAQVLTEEYSEHGVHVANVVIDGTIDSPGTHALPRASRTPTW